MTVDLVEEEGVFPRFFIGKRSVEVNVGNLVVAHSLLHVVFQALLGDGEVGGPAVEGVLFADEDFVGPGEGGRNKGYVESYVFAVEIGGDVEDYLQSGVDVCAEIGGPGGGGVGEVDDFIGDGEVGLCGWGELEAEGVVAAVEEAGEGDVVE